MTLDDYNSLAFTLGDTVTARWEDQFMATFGGELIREIIAASVEDKLIERSAFAAIARDWRARYLQYAQERNDERRMTCGTTA